MHLPTPPSKLVHTLETIAAVSILTAIPVVLAYHVGHAAVTHAPKHHVTAHPGSVVYEADDTPRVNYGGYIRETNTVILLQGGKTYKTDGDVGATIDLTDTSDVTLKIVALNATTGALTVETKIKNEK